MKFTIKRETILKLEQARKLQILNDQKNGKTTPTEKKGLSNVKISTGESVVLTIRTALIADWVRAGKADSFTLELGKHEMILHDGTGKIRLLTYLDTTISDELFTLADENGEFVLNSEVNLKTLQDLRKETAGINKTTKHEKTLKKSLEAVSNTRASLRTLANQYTEARRVALSIPFELALARAKEARGYRKQLRYILSQWENLIDGTFATPDEMKGIKAAVETAQTAIKRRDTYKPKFIYSPKAKEEQEKRNVEACRALYNAQGTIRNAFLNHLERTASHPDVRLHVAGYLSERLFVARKAMRMYHSIKPEFLTSYRVALAKLATATSQAPAAPVRARVVERENSTAKLQRLIALLS